MKKLLNTLYVTTKGSYLAKEGESVIVRVEQQTKLRVPIHALGSVVCFGRVSMSPQLMAFCGQRDVGISFLSEKGRFLARVEGPETGNVLLRREQYRRSDDRMASSEIARTMVIGKIANARTLLQRRLRDGVPAESEPRIRTVVKRLAHQLSLLGESLDLDTVRGIEGDASRAYFGVFDELITNADDSFRFSGRNRRPPTDNVNCLLSFLYTLLTHDLRSAIESVGLDPQVGFLHRDRPGRPSLALDLMEEFRSPIADRTALALINRKQLRDADFVRADGGGVSLKDDARKTVLSTYQERKQTPVIHPFLGEKVPTGLLFQLQARILARCLRGDLDGYPPYVLK